LSRHLNKIKNREERLFEEFVSSLKYFEFTRIINSFDHINSFAEAGITVLYENIAQHYGIRTRWLDITNDFDIALFFACCKYVDNKWMPLTNLDIDSKEESKYGIIFRKPTDHFSNILSSELIEYEVLPVGYQPFMRCSMQTAYSIFMTNDKDLQKSDFEILRFNQSEYLSNFIFERMEKGKKVYPHEGLTSILKQVDLINNSKIFSTEVFDVACDNFKDLTRKSWKQTIIDHNYKIGSSPITLTDNDIRLLNKDYESFSIEEFYNIDLKTRLTFRPDDREMKDD